MNGTSWIEIHKSALKTNLGFIKSFLNQGVRISSVVKGNAYGHGIEEFISIAEEYGIGHFSVFSVDEAERVMRVKAPGTEVMIMGWIGREQMEWVIDNELQFFVYEISTVYEAIITAARVGKKARIHIELETGMNRTGFKRKELKQLVDLIHENPGTFQVKGLCTHYAGAESIANHVRVMNQIKRFNRTYRWLLGKNVIPEIRHTACSAAAISYPKTQMDMVRIGILQYGFWPSRETFVQYVNKHYDKTDPLRRIISWKSKVMSVKSVKSGEFVSYGTTFLAQEDKTIAVVPVGYSHGFSRGLSNNGRVLIHGQRVAVVGMVNMNMLIADITGIGNDVNVGDEVVLIGSQGGLTISVASFSELSKAVNYELLVRLPASIDRNVTNGELPEMRNEVKLID